MELTKTQIAEWLDSIGKDREWLAKECGAAGKGTVDQWFSKGFSNQALATIKLLMNRAAPEDETALIQFTSGEFEKIDAARRALGYAHRPPFYRDAVLEFVKRISEGDIPAAQRHDLALVAEDRVQYQAQPEGLVTPGQTALSHKFVDAAREYVVQNPLPSPSPAPPAAGAAPGAGAAAAPPAATGAAGGSAGAPPPKGTPAAKRAGKA